eukprot:6952160-Pyramimonas_sp.AAC.1
MACQSPVGALTWHVRAPWELKHARAPGSANMLCWHSQGALTWHSSLGALPSYVRAPWELYHRMLELRGTSNMSCYSSLGAEACH